jgi:hypothetical protein
MCSDSVGRASAGDGWHKVFMLLLLLLLLLTVLPIKQQYHSTRNDYIDTVYLNIIKNIFKVRSCGQQSGQLHRLSRTLWPVATRDQCKASIE